MTEQNDWTKAILGEEISKAMERTEARVKQGQEAHQNQVRIAELRAKNEALGVLCIELQSALRPQDKEGRKKVDHLHKQIEQNEAEIARLTPKERDTSGGYTGSLRK